MLNKKNINTLVYVLQRRIKKIGATQKNAKI